MAVLETVLTTAGGAVSATVGVVVGVVLSRRAQDRHWLRDQQLAAYQELMRQYATFVMTLKRAHADRSGWDCDWAVWSAALTSASLVAPAEVADEPVMSSPTGRCPTHRPLWTPLTQNRTFAAQPNRRRGGFGTVASAVSQFWVFTCSRVTLPRRTFSRIDSAVAVQTNGFGSSLCACRYSSIAAISSGTLRNTPRRIALSVSSRNHRSTRFSQDEEVGVKCRWKRGRLASHALTLSWVWVP